MQNQSKKVVVNWSGGKDASLSLYQYLKKHDRSSIHSLFTTINERLQRITMHGVPVSLLEKQVKSLGLELELIGLPEDISMEKYSEVMRDRSRIHKESGVIEYVYGDINLVDLRAFRDQELEGSKITPIYPLWNKETGDLAKEFINLGFKAIVVATNSKLLKKEFAGRLYDQDFLNDLPEGVDPCGENGEFHTFVFDGPIFKNPVEFEKGEVTYKTYQPDEDDSDCFCCDKEPDDTWDKGFWFCEITPPSKHL